MWGKFTRTQTTGTFEQFRSFACKTLNKFYENKNIWQNLKNKIVQIYVLHFYNTQAMKLEYICSAKKTYFSRVFATNTAQRDTHTHTHTHTSTSNTTSTKTRREISPDTHTHKMTEATCKGHIFAHHHAHTIVPPNLLKPLFPVVRKWAGQLINSQVVKLLTFKRAKVGQPISPQACMSNFGVYKLMTGPSYKLLSGPSFGLFGLFL